MLTIYKKVQLFSSHNGTGFLCSSIMTGIDEGNHPTLLSYHAVSRGSSFRPAGPGCGEVGKTAVRHQQNFAHTKLSSHSKRTPFQSFQSVHLQSKLDAGRRSTQQLNCSQNQSKFKRVFPKL